MRIVRDGIGGLRYALTGGSDGVARFCNSMGDAFPVF